MVVYPTDIIVLQMGEQMSDATHAALLLRLPVAIKDWLRNRATINERSMSSEVKAILKAARESEAAFGGEKQ